MSLLTKSNSVTISESCLSELPPGVYHYTELIGEKLKSELVEAEENATILQDEIWQLREQLGFARELIASIEKKTTIESVRILIEQSSFEL